MGKNIYWLIESNYDLSVTCLNTETCMQLLKSEFESLEPEEQSDAQYTLTPVLYTSEEFDNLPEAE